MPLSDYGGRSRGVRLLEEDESTRSRDIYHPPNVRRFQQLRTLKTIRFNERTQAGHHKVRGAYRAIHSKREPPWRTQGPRHRQKRTTGVFQVTDDSFVLPTVGQTNFTQVFASSDICASTIHVRLPVEFPPPRLMASMNVS